MSGLSKRLWLSGAASLVIFGLADQALSQTATPEPAQTPASTAPSPPPSPTENAPAAPTENAPSTVLPQTNVQAPKQAAKPAKPRVVTREAGPAATATPAPAPLSPEQQAAAAVAAKNAVFNQARSNIYTNIGTASVTISHQTVEDLPQGTDTPFEKVLVQTLPGVSQDSAASGSLHVRNDHANVQYRINGVMLPDGVTGFGSVLDTSLFGNLSLIVGALPAEYGLRTVGIVDLTTRTDVFNNSGSVGVYGGSHGTFQPSAEYGGTFGGNCAANTATTGYYKAPAYADCFPGVQYFFTGTYLQNTVGIENPTANYNAIHDFTRQERGFAYMSAIVDPTTRVSLIAGSAINAFQIPNVPGAPQSPLVPSAFGVTNFDSSLLNENQYEVTHYGILAVQTSKDGLDTQLSYFTRYNYLHFTPDPIGDLLINGVASNVIRNSYTNGLQGDAAYQLNSSHTIRTGFTVSGEQVFVGNTSLVEPCMICDGSDTVDNPFNITDNVSKVGWLAGVYAQDEWKVTNQFTINAGLRFDQMYAFTNANQLSPRISFTYKPAENTTFHAGYARYFTPPVLVETAPTNIGLFANTTAAPSNSINDPVLPERSHYFDAGVDQKVPLGCSSPNGKDCSSFEIGFDAYYKIATDLIDNGQFGQALVLSAFNYARGYNEGVEFHAKYNSNYVQAYANLAIAQQKATDPVSNQFLFDNATPLADLGGLTEFQYLQTHWVYTDHNQFVTASAGAVYTVCGRPVTSAEAFGQAISWCGTKLSANVIYGSGLRDGDANISTVPAYAQVNVGVKRDFYLPNDPLPMTVRFDVVNLLDTVYLIRDGSGIGVFAPQYGPRRGFFLGLSKKI
jgi:outer membrane receptor protein involved in Fe transport